MADSARYHARMRSALLMAAVFAGATFAPALAQPATDHHTFAVADGHFQFDGKPYQILSG
jgi:hypothetical protein